MPCSNCSCIIGIFKYLALLKAFWTCIEDTAHILAFRTFSSNTFDSLGFLNHMFDKFNVSYRDNPIFKPNLSKCLTFFEILPVAFNLLIHKIYFMHQKLQKIFKELVFKK